MWRWVLIFMLICSVSNAELRYVYIEKRDGNVAKGEEAGHNAKGDVIAVTPYVAQYKPTRAERDMCIIKVVDLTDLEVEELLEEEKVWDSKVEEIGDYVTVRARKRKVDIDTLSNVQEETVVKEIFNNKVSVKSAMAVHE